MGRERGVIGGSEQFRVERGCEVGLLRGASRGGGAQLRGAGRGHAGEPVQALGAEQGKPGHADRGLDPVRAESRRTPGRVGPPPEWPMTANRSMPSASAMLATSAAADATFRPG